MILDELTLNVPIQTHSYKMFLIILIECLLGATLTLFTFWPGMMSPDTISHLSIARRIESMQDWHPPVMPYLVRAIDSVVPAPGGVLLFHVIIFWSSLALISYALIKRGAKRSPFLIPLLGFYPPIFFILGVVWKDVTFASLELFAYALVLIPTSSKKGRLLFDSSALIIALVGMLFRYNALLAVVPICMLIALRHFVVRITSPRIKGGGAIVIGILLPWIIHVASEKIYDRLHVLRVYPAQMTMSYDLAGIGATDAHVRWPRYLSLKRLRTHPIYEAYTPQGSGFLDGLVAPTKKERTFLQLKHAWVAAIVAHPRAYLLHRTRVFSRLLGITGEECDCTTYNQIDENVWGYALTESPFRSFMFDSVEPLQNSPLFKGYSCVIFMLVGFFLIYRKRIPFELSILPYSGALYLAPYFILVPTCDFRYVWWSVISAMVGVIIAVEYRSDQAVTD